MAKVKTATTVKKAAPKRGKKPMTKKDKARKIFAKFYETKERKDIIEKFMKQLDMTKNGAATYYQQFKTETEAEA